jgi:hypothetical protein
MELLAVGQAGKKHEPGHSSHHGFNLKDATDLRMPATGEELEICLSLPMSGAPQYTYVIVFSTHTPARPSRVQTWMVALISCPLGS